MTKSSMPTMLLFIFCLTTSAYSGTMGSSFSSFHYLARITGGANVASTSPHSQTLNLLPEVSGSSYYQDQSKTQTLGLLGGFLGFEKSFMYVRPWLWQFGISYYGTLGNYTDSGVLHQTLGVVTQNYAYQYQISNGQLYGENRLLLPIKENYYPYITVGLGAAFNRAMNYHTLAFESTSGDSPMFAARASASFAYLVGAGVDMDVFQRGRIGIGYRYAGLGIPHLNPSAVQTSDAVLNAGRLNNNQIVAELSLLIG